MTSAAPESYDFLVRRDDLSRTECRPLAAPDDVTLAEGEALLGVASFAMTANNVTYAVFGDAMQYWNFFPAPEGFGRIPVWGFATVVRSATEGVREGMRVFGYLPMSSHFVVRAGNVSAAGFDDLMPHRQPMSAFYNQYLDVAADPGYDAAREGEQMLFRPLFATAFLIDDFLAENRFFGARQVLVSSASSKTSMALAARLAARGKDVVEVVGLTSAGNKAFVESLGTYHRVVAYDGIEAMDGSVPSVFVDMAGDAKVTMAVHTRFGDLLGHSCQVGGTHWNRLAFGLEVPGPAPALFFAPDHLLARIGAWGAAEFQRRLGEAWQTFLPRIDRSVKIERSRGADAVRRVYLDTLAGKADPGIGHVLEP